MMRSVAWMTLVLSVATTPLTAAALDDPTRPPPPKRTAAVAKAAQPKLRLSYTLVAPGRSVAVINGSVVAVGETVAGARIEAIDSDGVTLRRAGKQLRLELLPKGNTPQYKESETP